ncbi:7-methylguanosine phosphate-specific 5'-nucleotidase-like isoform X2 [Phymastichus coffea]|nr:7-methylguanosine phosphate-specific 5'-nucleotidase-like isoform X2 [Phymastichus coffea]
MKNESAVFEKINAIISEGPDNLEFITDFDQTLTKQHENGVLSMDSAEIFFQSKQLPRTIVKAIQDLLTKFNAIPMINTINKERISESWKELIETVQTRLRGLPFDRTEIEKLVLQYGPSFRNGTSELFLRLHNLNIPVVIFSAGLSDVIEVQFSHENIHYDNISIIANRLKFNGTVLDGLENYKHPISVFNKHEYVSYFVSSKALKIRSNKILMGDNIGDVTIAHGFENKGTELTIGFFYNQTGNSLEMYKETFDIVLNDDQTMNVILDIIKWL